MTFGQKGFSLIEVLVAVGIMAIVALGMTSIAEFNFRAGKSVIQSYDFTSFDALVTMITADPATCAAALRNSSGALITTPSNTNPFFTDSNAVSQLWINGAPVVDVVRDGNKWGVGLTPFTITMNANGNLGNNTFLMTFTINGNKSGTGTNQSTAPVVGGNLISSTFQMIMTLTGGPPYGVASCSSAASPSGGTTVKAWVNFNALGVVTSSYNVASVTLYQSVYTVTFATPFANSNYSISVTNTPDTNGGMYFPQAPVGSSLKNNAPQPGPAYPGYFNLAIVNSVGEATKFQGGGGSASVTVSQ